MIVLSGALEAERWDRWLLQRIHRALAPAGVLVVHVPHLLDVFSAAGLGYLISRVVRQVRRRLAPRTAIPAADRGAFRGRRYQRAQLVRMCEGLHFEVLSCEPAGHALGGLARVLGPLGRLTPRGWTLIGRRQPSLWGPSPARPFPDAGAFVPAFEQRLGVSVAGRDAWSQRHGGAPVPQGFDAAHWGGAPVAVFSPHPDDEVIGCGGALIALAECGAQVTVVQVTDGSDSAAFIDEPEAVRTQVRLDEAGVVARGLGARELVCLRADNRALRATAELRDRFAEVLGRVRPSLVFAPSLTDLHPDHQTVIRLLADALETCPEPLPQVALYEVWGLVAPSHLLDVASLMPRLEALLLDYVTALKIDDYVHLVAERLLYNSYRHAGRAGYHEAYRLLEGREFVRLARATGHRE